MSKLILFILIPFFSFGQDFLYSTFESFWSISDIELISNSSFLPGYIAEINYEVNAHKVFYSTTNENGDSVIASGAIFTPINLSCPAPVLSFQHGTIVADSSAPSQKIEDSILGILSASHGYVVLMSDYLGLGEGEGAHNYCHSETEASSVIDLIFASHEFMENQGVEINDQLFLMGYSQGGHATMAAVKTIESSFTDNLSITASSPMAGPYSMSEAQSDMLDVVYPNPGYFPYVIFSYQRVYGNIYSDVNEFFKPGFENLEEMYNGTYSMDEINNEIWSIGETMYDIDMTEFTPLDMIKDDYYLEYIANENHPLRLALQDNDLIDFIPQSPMRIIHCNGDDNVSYANALLAYDSFTASGVDDVVLLDPGNFNHSDCALVSVISAKLWFDEMVEFCSPLLVNELVKDNKKVAYVFDVFGRKINSIQTKNQVFINFYSDGSVSSFFNITH